MILEFGKGRAPSDALDVGLITTPKVMCLIGRGSTTKTKQRMLGRGRFTGKIRRMKHFIFEKAQTTGVKIIDLQGSDFPIWMGIGEDEVRKIFLAAVRVPFPNATPKDVEKHFRISKVLVKPTDQTVHFDRLQKANIDPYTRVRRGRMERVKGYARAGARKAILLGLAVVMASVFSTTPVAAATIFGNRELFNQVTSSLNTPEKISEYQQKNFSYFRDLDSGGCGMPSIQANTKGCSPDYIFWSKRANCSAFSSFAVHCLKKAGYEAYTVKVQDRNMLGIHYLVIFKGDNGKWSIMNNGAPSPHGIKGSYDSIDETKSRLAELGHPVLNLELP